MATSRILSLFVLASLVLPLSGQGDPQAGLVGSKAAKFTLKSFGGKSLSCPPKNTALTQLRIVVFCASWSDHSKREIDLLKKLWPIWSKQGVEILAVNVEAAVIGEEERAKIKTWLEASKIPFPVAIDEDLKAFRAYGVVAVPTTVVIDDQNRILMRMSGFPVAKSSKLIGLVQSKLESEEKLRGRPMLLETLPHRRSARLLRMARLMMAQGKMDMAEYSLKKAIEKDPDQVEARGLLAALYRQSGKGDLAKKILTEARSKFPEDTGLLIEAAEQALADKDFDRAAAHVARALKDNPAYIPSLLLRGRIQLAKGTPEAALESFKAAAKVNPLNPTPLVEAAKVLEIQGKKAEAFNFYKQAFDLLRPELQ